MLIIVVRHVFVVGRSQIRLAADAFMTVVVVTLQSILDSYHEEFPVLLSCHVAQVHVHRDAATKPLLAQHELSRLRQGAGHLVAEALLCVPRV